MKPDQQDRDNNRSEQEKSAMNPQVHEPRIIAFCCQY
ncbi:hypothetical protein Dpo_12c00670 [Desulfotignum phosphitoxidans DSM 13687]|jgi:hypothetical protein|uniref:Uncharacterized protein n=1 Tax=Desulfotignum phosphitoxidans DSM 13687 TaxID=1286635 RepID=S0FXB8_9BACT|nr:hypothetical protein Dpo_12c00670 [Desulfotignum phosphitoxidans DSM 13687]